MTKSHLTLAFLASSLLPLPAHADAPAFGPQDVPTVFFISKSDDHNRVDYGLRLDDACAPVSKDPVLPYWREFEKAPPVRTHGLAWHEHVSFGVAKQKVVSRTADHTELAMRLRPFGREITIEARRDESGRCVATAHANIAGVPDAELAFVFIQLSGPISIDYVDIHGRDPRTGAVIEERVKR